MTGRPTKFQGEITCKHAAFLAHMGATDAQFAEFFEVSESTINKWKKDYPEFSEAVKEAKKLADNQVVKALYHRALGYSHKEDKVFCNAKGETTIVETTKHYPPDTAAAFIWLKNRDKENWRDRYEMAHTDPDGKPLDSEASLYDLARKVAFVLTGGTQEVQH